MTEVEIKSIVREYITSTFYNENEALTDETPLLSSGVIDSISSLQLVRFLEETFKFEFQPHEVDQDNLDTLVLIGEFVKSKI